MTTHEQPQPDPLATVDLFSLMGPLDMGEDDYCEERVFALPHQMGISPEDYDTEVRNNATQQSRSGKH